MTFCKSFYCSIITLAEMLQHVFLLAIRLYFGLAFFQAGIGKLKAIEPVIEFFQNLGIPFPTFNAYLVGIFETVGGLALLIGLASRLFAIPLAIIMVIALVTAHKEVTNAAFQALFSFENLHDFLAKFHTFTLEKAFNFLLATLIIFCFGPGIFSVDFILKRLFFKDEGRV